MSNISISALPITFEGQHSATPLWHVLWERIAENPFNLFASLIFLCAIIHTFIAPKFIKLSHAVPPVSPKNFAKKTLFHFLGEIEIIFGLWMIPLAIGIFLFFDWHAVLAHFNSVNYVEPLFIVVIMSIASSRPVLAFAETCLGVIASLGKKSPQAWWLSILIVGPLLGSFITEPAAITICSLLLAEHFYDLNPSPRFRYATLGLLFVNISVGGTLTHFAAPPILMVANQWNWNFQYMLTHFGIQAIVGILVTTLIYAILFKREFRELKNISTHKKNKKIPFFVTSAHLFFLAWTVLTIHAPALFIFGFLFFFAFTKITAVYQNKLNFKNPVLVGFFLAGLVTHGSLQQWWIEPVLGNLNEFSLFAGSSILTAFNDNAAITYLASLVPQIASDPALQHAVVCGAVTGGGLTIIANAPNPAGQSILQKYFSEGISPLKLFLGALTPTLILALCFNLL